MQKKNGFVEFHRFMKKERQLKQNLFKSVGTMGFCKLQTKKCEEISTTRLRHVNYLHSSSIYPQESENKTEKGRKSKVKIIATHFLRNKERKVAGIFGRFCQVS